MKTWKIIQKIEDRIGEFVARNIVVIGCVLVFVVIITCVLGCNESWIVTCGGVVGGCMVMYQWYSDRRVKRAELLRELLQQMGKYDIEKLLRGNGLDQKGDDKSTARCAPDVYDGFGDLSDDENLYDLLAFMSYICHLYRALIITDSEFSSLKWDIIKALESIRLFNLIKNIYQGERIGSRPYYDLLIIATDNCTERYSKAYRSILRGDNNVELIATDEDDGRYGCTDVIVSVDDMQEYENHLKVLNGLFNLGYRAHARGGAMLPDGKIIWFPRYTIGQPNGHQPSDCWSNYLSNNGVDLYEYSPVGKCNMTDRYHKIGSKRFAFGKNVDDDKEMPGYKFLGVFELQDSDAKKGEYHFKRISDVLTKMDVKYGKDA